jgi:hypothetical protein
VLNVNEYGSSLTKEVIKAIQIYNRFREPESKATLVEVVEGGIYKIKFAGSFLETCGVNDWIFDLEYIMRDLGLEVEIIDIEEPENDVWNEEGWRLAKFKVKQRSRSNSSKDSWSGASFKGSEVDQCGRVGSFEGCRGRLPS